MVKELKVSAEKDEDWNIEMRKIMKIIASLDEHQGICTSAVSLYIAPSQQIQTDGIVSACRRVILSKLDLGDFHKEFSHVSHHFNY